jgi:hypothetical protein
MKGCVLELGFRRSTGHGKARGEGLDWWEGYVLCIYLPNWCVVGMWAGNMLWWGEMRRYIIEERWKACLVWGCVDV